MGAQSLIGLRGIVWQKGAGPCMMDGDLAIRATSLDGHARVLACVTTDLVRELQRRHDTWPVVTAALGRTASIAAMMGLMLKGSERLTVQVKGDGPAGSIVVDADADGRVRGYVTNPQVALPSNAAGKLDVGRAVGQGMLYVMRDLGLKNVYRGSTALQSGEIADDFTYYFTVSEQTPSSVAAGVLVDKDFSVISAGAFIVQLLPGHTDEDIEALERRLATLHSVTDLLSREGADVRSLLAHIAPDAHVLETRPLQFACRCSRDRTAAVLRSLGAAELQSMLDDPGHAEVICHFCNEHYFFEHADVAELLDGSVHGQPSNDASVGAERMDEQP